MQSVPLLPNFEAVVWSANFVVQLVAATLVTISNTNLFIVRLQRTPSEMAAFQGCFYHRSTEVVVPVEDFSAQKLGIWIWHLKCIDF